MRTSPIALRVGVKNGGCAGQEYIFAYAEQIEPLDEVVEDKGVTILIDPKAMLFLIGSEIDYETTKLSSKFVSAIRTTDACGCGERDAGRLGCARDDFGDFAASPWRSSGSGPGSIVRARSSPCWTTTWSG
jgi:iron-sulfur cluster assembly accessory protein